MADHDGLYLLQDGTHAARSDVKRDKDGVLRHKNGLAVALYEDGSPQTVGEDAERNKNVEAALTGQEAVDKRNQVRAENAATAAPAAPAPTSPEPAPARRSPAPARPASARAPKPRR